MEKLLQEAIKNLPDNDDSIILFGKAYLYRRQFEDLAEHGIEYDSSGLMYALSKALSLSIGFEIKTVYEELERGIETIPNDLLPEILPDNFKQDLCAIVSDLTPYTVKTFFESLEWTKLDYNNPEKLQWAVSESLHSYARVAALGTGTTPFQIKKRNYQRGRGKIVK